MVATDETQPETESPPLTVWRYVDFVKFVSMLESSALHFTRIDQFDDAFEGFFTDATYRNIQTMLAQPQNAVYKSEDHLQFAMDLGTRLHRASVFANCWHINESESLPMWKMYGDVGIAIRSTDRRLIESTKVSGELIYFDPITYVDFERFAMDHSPESWIAATLIKRHHYDFEHEFRAYWLYPPQSEPGTIDLSRIANHPTGWRLPVDLKTLIEAVYVSPGKPEWFRELVRSVLQRYDLDSIPVQPSLLDTKPRILKTGTIEQYLTPATRETE